MALTDIKTQVKHAEIKELSNKGTDWRFLAELGRSTKETFQCLRNPRSLNNK